MIKKSILFLKEEISELPCWQELAKNEQLLPAGSLWGNLFYWAEKLAHWVASMVPVRPAQLLTQMRGAAHWPLSLCTQLSALHATGIFGFGCCE